MFELQAKSLQGRKRGGREESASRGSVYSQSMGLMNHQETSGFGARLFAAENLHLNFGNVKAINGVDFKLHQGEIVFLTGVSGAGKTTLLKVLGGFLEPDQGKIIRPHPKRVFTAPIFQDLKLLMNESCEKNLWSAYDRDIYKNKAEFESDLKELAKILGVQNRLHIKVKEANGGLKQKIAFMRAMLTRPDVLLADEPTAALDYDNAKKMFDILNIYNVKQGLTVVWATHNKELVKKFTGRMVHMDKGRLIYSGHACFI